MKFYTLSTQNRKMVTDEVFPILKKRMPLAALKKQGYSSVNHYLYENKDFVYCTACKHDISFKGDFDKHKSKRKCPRCHKEVTVLRSCCSKHITEMKNICYPEIIEGGLVNRYFHYNVDFFKDSCGISITEQIEEVAREIVKTNMLVRVELKYGTWVTVPNRETSGYWFSWTCGPFKNFFNENCVRIADVFRPQIKSLINQLNNVGLGTLGVDFYKEELVSEITTTSIYFNNELGEKLSKLGIMSLYDLVPYPNAKGSIINTLGISRELYKWFMGKDDKIKAYIFARKVYSLFDSNYSIKSLNLIYERFYFEYKEKKYYTSFTFPYDLDFTLFDNLSAHTEKKINYVTKNNIRLSIYSNYIEQVKRAEIDFNNSVLFPKDFEKAVADLKRTIEIKKLGKYSTQIENIAFALKKSDDIKAFMKSSKGLLIKIPESAEELIKEGARLHNCLSSYVEKVAQNKCLIFFVRKIDEPDKEFYAFEYRNGEIVQLRTHNNALGEKYDVIYSFCLDFIKVLRSVNDECVKVA